MCCGRRILRRKCPKRTKNEVWDKIFSGWWHLKKPWMDSEGFFPWNSVRLLFVNKHKIEDASKWCCRRTVLVNLLGTMIIKSCVASLWSYERTSPSKQTKFGTVIILFAFLAPIECSSHVANGNPSVHRKSLVKTDCRWDLNKASPLRHFLSQPHKNPKHRGSKQGQTKAVNDLKKLVWGKTQLNKERPIN